MLARLSANSCIALTECVRRFLASAIDQPCTGCSEGCEVMKGKVNSVGMLPATCRTHGRVGEECLQQMCRLRVFLQV